MNIFNIHNDIIADYSNYISSFLDIADPKIRDSVENYFSSQKLWPQALLQFNPAFKLAGDIDQLISEGLLNKNLKYIFKDYKLFHHQVEALNLGTKGKDFIVTSGTGSGKSLTYIGTIANYLFGLKEKRKGIKALVVYPMNALINSQSLEFEKYKDAFESSTGITFPITFSQYTGQETDTEKEAVKKEEPDILLTNYMMLELIMTRLGESSLRDSISENLKYLVFDELHTYRGRQGADVSMLIRRIHSITKNDLICIGTSATMSSGASIDEQKVEIAAVGKKIFGVDFQKDQVINETLINSLYNATEATNEELAEEINKDIDYNPSREELLRSKIAQWIEQNIAVKEQDGFLVRREPVSLEEIGKKLADETGTEEKRCSEQVRKLLTWANLINKEQGKLDNAILPFKLHQFISQTGSVYATLEYPSNRFITLDPSAFIIQDGEKKPLYPVVFSRISGYEFTCVRKNRVENKLEPREFTQRIADEEEDDVDLGYIVFDKDILIWNSDDISNLPDSWLKVKPNGEVIVNSTYADKLPQKLFFDEYGNYSEIKGKLPLEGWYMSAPILFDPTSGTFFDRKTAEGTKLSKLGTEGRSTSTTILSFATIKSLAAEQQEYREQKLLSFTDNRQDAALQAGHFNDFYKIGRLRSAIYNAIRNSGTGKLDHSLISDKVYEALQLPQELFAKSPSDLPAQKEENIKVFKDYIFYRIIADLKRGWRVTLPNLEQSGLVKISYKYLDETIDLPQFYNKSRFLTELDPEVRKDFVVQTLDYLRKNYALNHTLLEDNEIFRKSTQIREEIRADWGLDKNEQIDIPNYVRVETLARIPKRVFTVSIGAQSYFGKYLKALAKKIDFPLDNKNYAEVVYEILDAFENAKWITSREVTSDGKRINIFRLEVKSVIWELGDGETMVPDKIRFQSYKDYKHTINKFFRDFYKQDFSKLKNIEAREHTAQINNEDRKLREHEFREGKISVLNCSPTMELGIDIATLNIVHLRNVPPNPANYAQRSGRAGRSGQAALVLTFCSNYSPHDRNYFSNPVAMVSGIVTPPKIDLVNEELLRSHLHSLYLTEVGLSTLDHSIASLINMDASDLPLKSEITEKLNLLTTRKNLVYSYFKSAVKDIETELNKNKWYSEDWISRKLRYAPNEFDKALDRWRELYRSANKQLNTAQEIIRSNIYTNDSQEKRQAFVDEKQAGRQLDLLRNQNYKTKNFSEFYPYRYLAAEGFLPGYNFTRLPIRVFVPKGEEGEFISRPRFLAIREFGPNNIIYHDGARYKINQTILNDAENKIEKMKVSRNSAYALIRDDYDKDYCPFTGTYLKTDNERELYGDLLPLAENRSMQMDRISCEEEERLALGYDIRTYFTVEGGLDRVKTVNVKSDQDSLLMLRYIPAATLIKVNEKWRARKDPGFLVNIKTGFWKNESEFKKTPPPPEVKRVRLLTTDTSDAIYVHPLKALAFEKGKESDSIITMQYALKRAIENVFQIESAEIGVEVMGKSDWPNILIYESAEGSLGVLSQLVEDVTLFRKIVNEAYKICYFKDGEDTKPEIGPATYNDLLNYYNQRHHLLIDRHLIKGQLEKLRDCELELMGSSEFESYDDQYDSLMQRIDPTSTTEKKFLDYLYKNTLRLPDKAQYSVDGIYVKPDFYFKEGNVCVFCDGTPHDEQLIKEQDRSKREALINKGYDVVIYYYRDSLDDLIQKRSDIFYKIK